MKAVSLVRVVLIVALLSITTPISAASYSTDQSDLWWADPAGSENGWGFQIVQRGSTIFITMFVYGPSGAPTWYVATMTPNPPGSLVWSGDLFTTMGSWFGAVPYNSELFTVRKVGTVTWTSATATTGTLSYSVDGVVVTKSATRQTLVNENYNGHFLVALHDTATGCANPAENGTSEGDAILNIVQNGTSITMTLVATDNSSCTYTGTLSQSGQMGSIVATMACSTGEAGMFNFYELQVTPFSVAGRYTASTTNPAGCQDTGWLGGVTVTTLP